MEAFMVQMEEVLGAINGILWHDYVLLLLLGVGILFTLWSGFTQYRALTHGVQVIRGKYDRKDDPGAINHFQALSAALSATVGLGNIAGVAVAVGLGGPGAIFWMWVVGVVGMALKTVEVTLSMLYRNTDDPDNPHGGPMWVAALGFEGWMPKLVPLGKVIAVIFCVTLLISTVTGGNMFQAWNVAEVTNQYFPTIPKVAIGIILAMLVGMVIIGGIKRIGAVAGRLVPFMVVFYLISALYVLAVHIGDIPDMLRLIVSSAFSDTDASNAFLGGTAGYAFLWGMKRALFSNEAGQGSAPIAHAAAKTDEPVREGLVAGLGPFIDTIIVCTLTSLVILSTGAWNREAEAMLPATPELALQSATLAELPAPPTITAKGAGAYTLEQTTLPQSGKPWTEGQAVFALVTFPNGYGEGIPLDRAIPGTVKAASGGFVVEWGMAEGAETPVPASRTIFEGDTPAWALPEMPAPPKNPEARRISGKWQPTNGVFLVVESALDPSTGRDLHKITGTITEKDDESLVVTWDPLRDMQRPRIGDLGVYGNYAGAALTSHAFDRVTPGLGMWLVVLASWLFALSTMISWSYYGEQGVVYLIGERGVMIYKLIYCLLIVVACAGFIKTDAQLDAWTALGTGCMLFANIPIMLIFSRKAMGAYREYMGKLKRGDFHPHATPKAVDVIDGKDG